MSLLAIATGVEEQHCPRQVHWLLFSGVGVAPCALCALAVAVCDPWAGHACVSSGPAETATNQKLKSTATIRLNSGRCMVPR